MYHDFQTRALLSFLCRYATIQLLDELPLGEFCVRKEFSIIDHTYQRPLQLPACCSVLSAEEMTYTEGGALSINITPEQVMAFGINATVNLLGMMGRYAFQAAVSGMQNALNDGLGVGDAIANSKALDEAVAELAAITGQAPVVTKAKKSIANFKLREGMAIGCKVTLRREKMYDFLDKLMNISLPRVRDFRGVSDTSFDGRGNYTLGIKEQIIFPEIDYDKINKVRGMDVVIVTTAKTNEEAKALLTEMGMPFKK